MGYDFTSLKKGSKSFSLNIHGMSEVLDALYEKGVLDCVSKAGKWPEVEKDESEMEIFFHRDQPSPIPGTVASWKFGTNDWWLVNANEARIIAEALKDNPDKYISQFVKFNLDAAEAGGYRVS